MATKKPRPRVIDTFVTQDVFKADHFAQSARQQGMKARTLRRNVKADNAVIPVYAVVVRGGE